MSRAKKESRLKMTILQPQRLTKQYKDNIAVDHINLSIEVIPDF